MSLLECLLASRRVFRSKLKQNIFARIQVAKQEKINLKSADHCFRGLKLAVDETKQLKLNELKTISKFLVHFHQVGMEKQAATSYVQHYCLTDKYEQICCFHSQLLNNIKTLIYKH